MRTKDMLHHLRERYRALQAERERLAKEMETIQEEMQRICSHPHVAELSYRPSTYFGSVSPPRRICVECGLEEDGWTYKTLLAEPFRMIETDELCLLRRLPPLTYKEAVEVVREATEPIQN